MSAEATRDRADPRGLLEGYLRYLRIERGLSPHTLRNYRSDLRHFLAFLEASDTVLTAVTRAVYRAYLMAQREAGLAPASLRRRGSTIKAFFRHLAAEEALPGNPLTLATIPKGARRLPSVLSLEHVEALLAAPDADTPAGLRDRAILEMLYGAGLRVSELVGLRIQDVDWENDILLVRGKGRQERVAFLGGPARAALRDYLRRGRPQFARAESDGSLWLNRFGGRLSARAVQTAVRRYAVQAALPGPVHPHLLRHTFATHMLNGGADLRVVQELLGHVSVGTTQVYTHVTDASKRAAIEDSLSGLRDQLLERVDAALRERDGEHMSRVGRGPETGAST